jgi:hypothetical protein
MFFVGHSLSNIEETVVAGCKNGKHSFEIFEKLKIVTKAFFSCNSK